jgi:hypothetical protein
MSYTLIERKELTDAASSIEFTGIPQFYTDLIVLASLRNNRPGSVAEDYGVFFNGDTNSSNNSARQLLGTGTSALSRSAYNYGAITSSSGSTSNTFSSVSIYVPNYSSSTAKSASVDVVAENNGTEAYQAITDRLWTGTSPITSLRISNGDSGGTNSFVAGSSISLYGINRQQAIGAPKAVGGAITFANGYWNHTFTASGDFYSLENLTVDTLIVAGGGGTSKNNGRYGGGGGAGGLLQRSTINVPALVTNPILVGAGGSGAISIGRGTNGSDSFAFSLTAIGGGSGGIGSELGSPNGAAGGSGGGATSVNGSGGAGTAGQGNSGGSTSTGGGSGGGGAGAAGQGQQGSNGGAGGAGLSWINGLFYAGGGAGGGQVGGAGGSGGGGSGSSENVPRTNGSSGTENTGGGAGASYPNQSTIGNANGNNGGSGVVIIRYPA